MKLIAFTLTTVVLFFTSTALVSADHNSDDSLNQRVAAVGSLNVMTAEEAAAEKAAAAEASVQVAAAGPVDGAAVYQSACLACHDAGIAGAPKLGDAAAWGPRIAQGVELLNEHAIKGFQGKTGVMPAKGGNAALTDEQVIAAVTHMVENSQ